MSTTMTVAGAAAPAEDQRVVLCDVSWADFELILQIRGDRGGVRMTYLNGVLELMSPSANHEGVKKTLARLLEAYADDLVEMASHIDPENQTESVRRYRQTLRRATP